MPANATPKALNAASGGAAGGGADASAGESMTPADGNGLATPDAGAGPDLVPTGEDGLTVAEVEARLARGPTCTLGPMAMTAAAARAAVAAVAFQG